MRGHIRKATLPCSETEILTHVFLLCTLLALLYLQSNRFTGNIPQRLEKIVFLKYLRLSDNKFTGSIPSTISQLLKLENFHLNGNDLTGKVPDRFLPLQNLKVSCCSAVVSLVDCYYCACNSSKELIPFCFVLFRRFSWTITSSLAPCRNL